ncbi:unnamed protein product [Cuscuta campestris]|uniref:Uncharacterized protein n=1 Tax=Cuscuta campestris TaxID=132261 RepID=A0A484KU40_9ASTE|nr:unnamed protein product [Cuscuta campestris]
MAAAVLFFNAAPTTVFLSFHSSSSSSSRLSSSLLAAHPPLRFDTTCNVVASKSSIYPRILGPHFLKERDALVTNAAASTGSVDGNTPEPPPEIREENVSVENLPLESKVQENLEQRMRTKMAKKIRMRRKRLLQKRHLRKKGRWPPSKMKKNQNV